jgi:hypothetical protein
MLEYYMVIGILFLILIFVLKKDIGKTVSQKNVDHIEFSPIGPILKTRLDYSRHEIYPTPVQKGYYSFLNFKKE